MKTHFMKAYFIIFLFLITKLYSQQSMVTYAGGTSSEKFNDVIQLSNGNFLVVGVCDNLSWLPPTITPVTLTSPSIPNNLGTNKYAFIAQFSTDLQTMIGFFHLPQGAAEDFRFIKTNSMLGEETDALFISGNTEDSGNGGYFIGRLNNNFISGLPTGFTYVINIKAVTNQYPDIYQPWDVDAIGRVVYAGGDSHDYNWSVIYRNDVDGSDDVVENWRVHWKSGGGEHYGNASSFAGGVSNLLYSAIVFKRDPNRCELRSTNITDYNLTTPDGNGGTKKGKWPMDVIYDSPCAPGMPGNTTNGPGYTGYSPGATFTYGPQSICIDRRNNNMYIGFNFKSVLPDALPDFEPAVMAMDSTGSLLWYTRLYHEIQPDGDTMLSTPDQYIDALAIDYTNDYLVVSGRAHGNNVENLWEGNEITANPTANGFQNRFTGTNGNIHISWLGKFTLTNATLMHSTYVAENTDFPTGLGSAHPDPNLDGWHDPNTGWPTLNTTYLGKNRMKVSADGSVIVLGKGRRTITTANAYQKMNRPNGSGVSSWNDFVRVYKSDLSIPLYSSILTGQWDTIVGTGGDNINLLGAFKTDSGVVVVGFHEGTGSDMPTSNIPSWGNSTFNSESAVLGYLKASNIINNDDSPIIDASGSSINEEQNIEVLISPNPTTNFILIGVPIELIDGNIQITDIMGKVIYSSQINTSTIQVSLENYSAGIYTVTMIHSTYSAREIIIKK